MITCVCSVLLVSIVFTPHMLVVFYNACIVYTHFLYCPFVTGKISPKTHDLCKKKKNNATVTNVEIAEGREFHDEASIYFADH